MSAVLSLDGVVFGTGVPERGDLYVLVHHRNHLPVMSARPLPDAAPGCEADYCVDFRNVQSYQGCAQLRAGEVYMMAAGDVNRSGVVSWGDDDFLLGTRGGVGYTRSGANYRVDADLDFDGRVSPADFRMIMDNHLLASECGPASPAGDR